MNVQLRHLFLFFTANIFLALKGREIVDALRSNNLLRFFILVSASFLLVGVHKMLSKSHIASTELLVVYVLFSLLLSFNFFTNRPEEFLHFAQFGGFAFLLAVYLSKKLSTPKTYALGFLMAALLGIFDEVVQSLVPGRIFDSFDIALNIVGALSGTVVFYLWRRSLRRKKIGVSQ